MSNSRKVSRRIRSDPYEVYDALPAAIRAALQEGPQEWCSVWVHTRWRRFLSKFGPTTAIKLTVQEIMQAHEVEIAAARPWQPKRWRRAGKPAKPLPSPHTLAKVGMQMSGRAA